MAIRNIVILIFFASAVFEENLFAQYRPSTAPDQPVTSQCYENADERIVQLLSDGERIVRAIRQEDSNTLLQYFHEGGVALGADHHVTKDQVRQDLRSRKGWVYATFFDTIQLRKLAGEARVSTEETNGMILVRDRIRSLYDYFSKTATIVIEAYRIPDLPFSKSTPLWAVLSFQWEDRPPKGIYYDPIFVCTAQGWKFSTFFNNP